MLYTKPPKIARSPDGPFKGDHESVIVPVFKAEEGLVVNDDGKLREPVINLYKVGGFKGDLGDIAQASVDGKLVVYAGLGGSESRGYRRLENIRRGYARAVKRLVDSRRSVMISTGGLDDAEAYEAVVASLLGAYRLEAFTSNSKRKLEAVYVDRDLPLEEIEGLVEGVYLARDVANAPPHQLPPKKLAQAVADLFRGFDSVEVEVLDYEDLVEGGFGGIVSVGMGSEEKPVLIVAHYKGGGRRVAVVGKTVVFDSGGINLKPSQGMTSMRADKAGGAAALGTLWAAARLGLKVDLYALLPAVINVPSGSSYLPSDVIRMWDGTRVEITNTDAEGRLIIADAIAYASKELKAEEVIDLATLTGAIVVALGPLVAGLFTRDDEMADKLLKASERTGEALWRMPMVDEYAESLTRPAQVGDIVNAAQRYGGAIFGALFLERFSHGARHAHIDMAGPGIAYEASYLTPDYWPDKGLAPGYGVRLLVEYLKNSQ